MAGFPDRSKRVLGPMALAAALLFATPGTAGELITRDGEEPSASGRLHQDLKQLIERELDRLRNRLEGALEDLPRYALPEMNEDGDIIIRRLPREPERWRNRPDESDGTLDL